MPRVLTSRRADELRAARERDHREWVEDFQRTIDLIPELIGVTRVDPAPHGPAVQALERKAPRGSGDGLDSGIEETAAPASKPRQAREGVGPG